MFADDLLLKEQPEEKDGNANYFTVFLFFQWTRIFLYQEDIMETRVAVIGIIVENTESAEKINSILHEYAQYIIGRMGVPYQKRKISVISIIMDAPQPVISALSGKLGKLEGVSTKALYSNVMENVDG
ncbi:putative iron-only hydrogenase system regulator [Erysipelotrichaceae bacterium 3_1_53]|nr:putative iron-only hydrogenase system regulator [Erysipelotrichaceae bacterium 3_1_53]